MFNYDKSPTEIFLIGSRLLICSTLILFIIPHTRLSSTPDHILHSVSSVPPFIIPANSTHTGTIIFLHGHGQQCKVWEVELIKIKQPYMKVICPIANEWPVTYHNGLNMSSWYDFVGLQYPEVHENASRMDAATAYVHHLIDGEVKEGISPENIIISGYSQGGPIALHAALSYPKKLGGIVTFSTFEPLKRTFTKAFNKANKDIPILHCHLKIAPFLTEGAGNRTYKLMQSVSKKTDFREYDGEQYVVEEEIEDWRDFCKKHIKKPPPPAPEDF